MKTPYTPMQPPAPGPRILRFPEDRSYGEIVVPPKGGWPERPYIR